MEILAALPVEDIIKEITSKASVIDYERLVRLLISACKLGKHPIPRESDLINLLINKYCYVTEKEGTLIVKSEHKYDFTTQRRLAALRDYTIWTLERNGGTYDLAKLMEEFGTKFT